MAKRKIELTFEMPSSVSNTELRQYITEALESSGGSRRSDDHLFNSLNVLSIRFVPVNKREFP